MEYDTEKLKTINASVATIDTEAEFNTEHLQEIADQYRPDAVFIEYNGTWGVGEVYEMELPKNWVIVQSLATVDATTFEMYMANMRSMMMEQFFQAEVVIFNRCDDNTPKSKFRGNIKAVNRPAQIVYERADGTIDDREEELPFDINADVIEISDADYALWFMDCMENPKKYDGKKVHFLGLVYNPKDGKLNARRYRAGTFCHDLLRGGHYLPWHDVQDRHGKYTGASLLDRPYRTYQG